MKKPEERLCFYINSRLLILEEYYNLINIFKKQNINKLPSHREDYDIEIELKPRKMPNFKFLYNMSREEL